MLLTTTIPPNSCGGIHAEFGKADYYFEKNELGDLVCDVDDEKHIVALIDSGNFFPYEEDDYDAASKLLGDDEPDMSNLGDDELDEEDDDIVDPSAPPVEGVGAADKKPPRNRAKKDG